MMHKDTESSGLSNTSPDLFISDLHLCASRPQITAAFLHFLNRLAGQAHALYILGDLFEYWAGDDEIENSHHQPVIAALRALAAQGVALYFMHGNRDFLIASRFCEAASISLLPDPSLINLHGKRVLLSHGDALCTDDVSYQAFRSQVRAAQWQQNFLSQPLALRQQQIEAIRMRSEQEKSTKHAQIMDVNQHALTALLSAYDYPELLIHGHTHRPDQHQLQLNGHEITRWVLGDWYEQGSYLACDQHGCKAMNLAATPVADA
jgi:UDP-2,3-diacylglucosamine hydrolase